MAKQRGKGRDGRLERTWRRRLARYESSGLTVREFCEREDVPEASFYHWRREVGMRDRATGALRCGSREDRHQAKRACKPSRDKRSRRSSVCGRVGRRRSVPPLFLPVHVKDGPSSTSGAGSGSHRETVTPDDGVIELRLPSGHVLRGGAVEKLARLAALLDGSTRLTGANSPC